LAAWKDPNTPPVKIKVSQQIMNF